MGFLKSTGEMPGLSEYSDGLEVVDEVIGIAGGFAVKEVGKIAVRETVQPYVKRLCETLKQKQDSGEIPPDYQATEHGAFLFQEALNALLEGRDKDRATAAQNVFIGLAKNPVEDSLRRVEQAEISKIAAGLSMWELVLLNALERYSMTHYKAESAEAYARSGTEGKKLSEIPQGIVKGLTSG